MSNLNTVKHTALKTLTVQATGNINDMERKWLLAQTGATKGHNNDLWMTYMKARGATSNNFSTASQQFLAAEGFTGNINTAWRGWWAAGGVLMEEEEDD